MTSGAPALMVSPSEDSRTSSKVTFDPAAAFMSGSRRVLPFSARNCLPKARKIAYMDETRSMKVA